MRKIAYKPKHGRRAFMDLSGRHKPKLHGGAFRMGDRAAAYVWLLDWRMRNPHDHIIVIDDPHREEVKQWAACLDAEWMFSEIANEIWISDSHEEFIPKPNAYTMYHTNMWRIWLWLRKHKICKPTLRPKADSLKRMDQLLHKLKVPRPFVTVQPLYDAKYNTFRNAPPTWWQMLASEAGKMRPVVLIGTETSAKQMVKVPRNCFPLWDHALSPMDSMALISMAEAHIGGETGTTLWAPIFNVPTIGVYLHWGDTGGHFPMDCRPMPFGSQVRHMSLNGSPDTVNKSLSLLLK
jgi:ADP-heptose:LPS heptosyltransferase